MARGEETLTVESIIPQIKHNFAFVPWAPLILTSSETGQNITKIFDLTLATVESRKTRVTTPQLNKWLKKIAVKHPPAGLKNKTPKLQYMVQEHDNPNPTFKVYGSNTRLLHWSYKRFMERELREEFGFEGTPIKFWFFNDKSKV
jgi:GTP-binding protein